MYLFGHAGLTLGAVRAVDRGADLRWAAALSLAPDLLDKPAAALFPALVNHNTKGFAHTALCSLLLLAALLAWKRPARRALALWGCFAGHLVLDAMWAHPGVLLWPLLGPLPAPVWPDGFDWLTPWYVLGEVAGVAVVVKLFQRHGLADRRRLAAFLKTGDLA